MKSPTPKQYLKLAGDPVILHTLNAFVAMEEIDYVVYVCNDPEEHVNIETIKTSRNPNKIRAVRGGKTRNESTSKAIESIHEQEAKIIIHDGVRPLASQHLIKKCINALDSHRAIDTIVPSSDTLIEVRGDYITGFADRSLIFRGQTPQAFDLGLIRSAYEKWKLDGSPELTDDCGVVARYEPGTPIYCISGESSNIKITEPIDLYIAEKLFQVRTIELLDEQPQAKITQNGCAVVVGGKTGIGEAISKLLQDFGMKVFDFSRTTGGPDITSFDAIERALEEVRKHTKISVIVNCGASLTPGNLVELPVEEIRREIDVNILGSLFVAKASFKYLSETQGDLIMFGSSSYNRGRAGFATYSASKSAVVNLTQALADEWNGRGIRVNCISPERTRTPLREVAFGLENEQMLLSPESVARAVLTVLELKLTGMTFEIKL